MRREIIQNIAILLVATIMAIGWWTEYVMPRHDVTMATQVCMAKQGIDTRMHTYAELKPQWDACEDLASKEHGSKLLEVMGF